MSISDVELSHRDKLLKRITAKVIDVCYNEGIFNTCLSCNHFDEKDEICRLYQQRPPARIIAKGCDQHTDEVPF